LAITSLSVASTTLETSLTTDPDEEINPNWESLPIGQDDAAAIQESIEGGGGESDGGGGSGSTDATGSATDDRSLFDRLIALLSRLFRLLLPIAAVLAVAALAYRYRDLLADLFGRDSRTTLPPSRDRRLNAGPERPRTRRGPGLGGADTPAEPESTRDDDPRRAARSLAFEASIATPSSRSSPRSSTCTTADARSTRRPTGLATGSARWRTT